MGNIRQSVSDQRLEQAQHRGNIMTVQDSLRAVEIGPFTECVLYPLFIFLRESRHYSSPLGGVISLVIENSITYYNIIIIL